MYTRGRLFSKSNEGLAAARPKATTRASYTQTKFIFLSIREEELWAGDGRLFPAALTVHGDGI